MASISEYYNVVGRFIQQLEELYSIVNEERLKIESPELSSSIDWYGTLWNIQDTINKMQLMYSIHQFERVSKEKMQLLLSQSYSGESIGKVVRNIEYKKREFDTLRTIENQYGVTWQEILQYNNMTSEDFNNSEKIIIPITSEIENETNKNVPVFGSQEGKKVLGTDLPIILQVGIDGDLLALNEEASFVQLINTISNAQQGDFPFYENFGLQLNIDEDMPDEAIDAMLQIKIYNGFKQDARIKEVEILSIEHKGTTRLVTVVIHTITGGSINLQV